MTIRTAIDIEVLRLSDGVRIAIGAAQGSSRPQLLTYPEVLRLSEFLSEYRAGGEGCTSAGGLDFEIVGTDLVLTGASTTIVPRTMWLLLARELRRSFQ